MWHSALPSGPGGNPVCGVAPFWVVCYALPKQKVILYPQEVEDAMGE